MKSVRLSLLRFAALAGMIAGGAPARADVAQVKPDQASKHFAAVSGHLELGGVLFHYMDVDGDLSMLGELADGFIRLAPGVREQMANLSVQQIVEGLGLSSVKAIGLSSRTAGPGLYHNQAFLLTPGGPAGLLKLFGTKPAPFTSAKLAPKGSDLVVEQDISLAALLEIADSVVKNMGNSLVEQQYGLAKKIPVPGVGMTAEDLLKKIDTRITLIVRFHDQEKLTIPGGPVIPVIDSLLCVERLGFAFKFLEQAVAESDAWSVEKNDRFTTIRPTAPPAPGLEYYKPVILHEKASDRVYFSGTAEFLKICTEGAAPVSGDPAWQAAMTGLPVSGNTLTYATPEVYGLLKEIMQAAGGTFPSSDREMLTRVLAVLEKLNFAPQKPTASVRTMLPDGMFFASNTSDNHKTTIVQSAFVPLMIIGAAANAGQALQAKAQGGPQRDEPLPEDDKVTPEQQVEYNLQQISLAAESYFVDNTSMKEVSYEKLVETQYLNAIKVASGESYAGLKVKRGGGRITVKTSAGEDISHNYPPVTD